MDVESKLIRKRTFTPDKVHDSQVIELLISSNEQSWFGDKTFANNQLQQKARKEGVFYGISDKATRSKKLPIRQEVRNYNKSRVRSAVEHTF